MDCLVEHLCAHLWETWSIHFCLCFWISIFKKWFTPMDVLLTGFTPWSPPMPESLQRTMWSSEVTNFQKMWVQMCFWCYNSSMCAYPEFSSLKWVWVKWESLDLSHRWPIPGRAALSNMKGSLWYLILLFSRETPKQLSYKDPLRTSGGDISYVP